MSKIILKSFIVLMFLVVPELLFFNSCKTDEDGIPNTYVNFYININSTQYIDLNSIGGWAYLTGGVRGIIVYRHSMEEFVALERNCPYHPSDDCAIVDVEPSGMTAVDSCCGSRFLLMDGSLVNGPATRSLKLYQTSFDGNILHVFN